MYYPTITQPNQNLETYQRQAKDLESKFWQLQQLQSTPVQSLPTPPLHIDYVQGIDGAREFQSKMPPSSSAVIMDKDEAVFYVVSKDANGSPAPIAFAHFELQTDAVPAAPQYITKQDFDDFRAELMDMLSRRGDGA